MPDLTASQENYLEAILQVARGEGHAHVKQIAERLGVAMASVSEAVRKLADAGLVDYRRYGVVRLTEAGRGLARQVEERHEILKNFLRTVLGLEPAEAEQNACRMEHAMDEKALRRLAAYVQFVQECPMEACTWRAKDGGFCGGVENTDSCRDRLEQALERLKREENHPS